MGQTCASSSQVLFTGVVDEAGEKVLTRLGGSMATGVADMNCLVADKVRRTVKFLCAVAKGIPIVTPQWLEKVRWPVPDIQGFKVFVVMCTEIKVCFWFYFVPYRMIIAKKYK